MSDSFTCPNCGMTSFNAADVLYGYCGHCHRYVSDGPLMTASRPHRDEPGGMWMEAIRHLAEAQRLMGEMTFPVPEQFESPTLADPYAVFFKAAAESIRAHYEATLRANEYTRARVVVDNEGTVHVVRED